MWLPGLVSQLKSELHKPLILKWNNLQNQRQTKTIYWQILHLAGLKSSAGEAIEMCWQLLCFTDVKPVKIKKERQRQKSSSSSSSSSEVEEEQEDEKYEPDLDLEADFPQGKHT